MKKIALLCMLFAGIASCTYRYENCTFNGVEKGDMPLVQHSADSTVQTINPEAGSEMYHEETQEAAPSDFPENY
jgi:hypothetical protein